MKASIATTTLAVALAAILVSESALAHRTGHHRHGWRSGLALGLVIGAPLGYHYGRYGHYDTYDYGYRYRHDYYYRYAPPPPPPEAVSAPPPGYRGPPLATTPLLPNYSYFCDRTNAYYPDVKECEGGWSYFPP